MKQTPRDSSVRAWEETVTIPTYPLPAPDRNPMFLERRVYQGSNGKVYPNPWTDRVSDTLIDHEYRAVYLENEFVHLMLLPDIGGRIHAGFDKTANYDFFYRQHVIKPALVGLLGPWISGGVEFNWPQHHRPSTFMPVEYHIEAHADGSRTVWLSEHEPMNRMKGMVGICLRPGTSVIEAKVRLYNRTPFVQTFLWWANVGIRVHDQYQAFFPPDVTYVADHAKRAMSSFPVARNVYYGVDYTSGVDIAWYKNIPVPTSYMVTQSKYDFFGGYDHAKRAGVVHVANHHLAPGKKLWTWGNAEFGYAWDRELTDTDGPYIELMAGVYTDNQPDFSWLHPYETKTFSQYWYPIQEIGPAKNANRLVAVNLEGDGRQWQIGVNATEAIGQARVLVTTAGDVALEQTVDLAPGRPFVTTVELVAECPATDVLLRVIAHDGREIIRYQPEERQETKVPDPATAPLPPAEIASSDELYLTGVHLEQYRHVTRRPEAYWTEALRRDPDDARCHTALGALMLREGRLADAEGHFRRAIGRVTHRNPNPYDGEPYYQLGLALRYQGRRDEAYAAFYKAVWNAAWQAPGYYALATLDCARGDGAAALDHLDRSLAVNALHLKARNLKTAILRMLDRQTEALAVAHETIRIDPLDFWSQHEVVLMSQAAECEARYRDFFQIMRFDAQHVLDLAFDYAEAGLWQDAIDLVTRFIKAVQSRGETGVYPMIHYALGFFATQRGDRAMAERECALAGAASPDYCFPARIDEMLVLQAALATNPADAKAHYYLGNLLYDKRRHEEAIRHWESACERSPSFATAWRNLGIALYNARGDAERAVRCYDKALEADPHDARVLYELDQLQKRIGTMPAARLASLERRIDLVRQRDDLTVELVTLYNQTNQSERALATLAGRRFHPWEGGEGLVSGQYVAGHVQLGRALLAQGDPAAALQHFDAARIYPENLGEGKHLLTSEAQLDYFSGVALDALGRTEAAEVCWRRAAETHPGPSVMMYYKALALQHLGDGEQAKALLEELIAFATRHIDAPVTTDYFATSLPNFLLFDDDDAIRNRIHCLLLSGLGKLGLGRCEEAVSDFQDVVTLDNTHVAALEELRYMDATLSQTRIR